MNFELFSVVVVLLFGAVHSQLTCNKCVGSRTGRGDCDNEEKCKTVQTYCLAQHWVGNEITNKKSNTYDTRCATGDECSDDGRRQLCSGGNCEARCCPTSKCDPFPQNEADIVSSDERAFHCHACSRESLDFCVSTNQKCEDDEDACISFLLEGGNHDKVYTKRCARKNECTQSGLDRLCALERVQSNRKECKASCCFDERCNEASLKTISMFVIAVAALLAIVFN